jgi:hypothetical protein
VECETDAKSNRISRQIVVWRGGRRRRGASLSDDRHQQAHQQAEDVMRPTEFLILPVTLIAGLLAGCQSPPPPATAPTRLLPATTRGRTEPLGLTKLPFTDPAKIPRH